MLSEQEPDHVRVDVLADELARLFADDTDSRQCFAAASAVLRQLAVVAGGPGTGKTTTVARIVALLAEQAASARSAAPLVALAAPTGKAAARLEEAVHREASKLPVDDPIRAQLLAHVVIDDGLASVEFQRRDQLGGSAALGSSASRRSSAWISSVNGLSFELIKALLILRRHLRAQRRPHGVAIQARLPRQLLDRDAPDEVSRRSSARCSTPTNPSSAPRSPTTKGEASHPPDASGRAPRGSDFDRRGSVFTRRRQ